MQLLVFPELSLSGYELANAAELALTLDDLACCRSVQRRNHGR